MQSMLRESRRIGKKVLWVAVVAVVLVTGGYLGWSQWYRNDPVEIKLVSPLLPSLLVIEDLEVRVMNSKTDTPIDDATLYVTGTVAETNIPPLLATVEGGANGLYSIPFEWTQEGVWALRIQATTNDGTSTAQLFDLYVNGSEGLCSFHQNNS